MLVKSQVIPLVENWMKNGEIITLKEQENEKEEEEEISIIHPTFRSTTQNNEDISSSSSSSTSFQEMNKLKHRRKNLIFKVCFFENRMNYIFVLIDSLISL